MHEADVTGGKNLMQSLEQRADHCGRRLCTLESHASFAIEPRQGGFGSCILFIVDLENFAARWNLETEHLIEPSRDSFAGQRAHIADGAIWNDWEAPYKSVRVKATRSASANCFWNRNARSESGWLKHSSARMGSTRTV